MDALTSRHEAAAGPLSWTPILEGAVRDRALLEVTEIAESLMQAEWSPRSLSYGLAGGNSGLAVLYDAIARALHDPRFASQRDIRWNAAVDQVAEVDSHPSLYAGYSGLGWATAMLGDGVSENEDTVHEELEEAMLACLDEPPQTYDLVSGPVGWALYSLERWPRPRAQRALRRILEHLGRSAERVSDGFRWWTPPHVLPSWQRERAPRGHYNLGMAHGIPAIIVLLSEMVARDIHPEEALGLLTGAVDWLLSQRNDGPGITFPSTVVDGEVGQPSRLAWCYGDLGLAAGLLVAARCAREAAWEASALEIARGAATVSREDGDVRDSGLCHGTAGIAHVFNRMYQLSGDTALLEAARLWLAETLRIKRSARGVAAWPAWRMQPADGKNEWAWVPLPGLLEGAAGVALALLAACTTQDPTWDRFLFVSPVPVA